MTVAVAGILLFFVLLLWLVHLRRSRQIRQMADTLEAFPKTTATSGSACLRRTRL